MTLEVRTPGEPGPGAGEVLTPVPELRSPLKLVHRCFSSSAGQRPFTRGRAHAFQRQRSLRRERASHVNKICNHTLILLGRCACTRRRQTFWRKQVKKRSIYVKETARREKDSGMTAGKCLISLQMLINCMLFTEGVTLIVIWHRTYIIYCLFKTIRGHLFAQNPLCLVKLTVNIFSVKNTHKWKK